jgi:DNA-binding NtrC family response regulator
MKLREMERDIILIRLDQLKGNRTHTARSLGIGIRTLQRKLRQYGVEPGTQAGKSSKTTTEATNVTAI